MTFESNLSNTELVSVLEKIYARINTLKQDDSIPAILMRQELFQKQCMVISILNDRNGYGNKRMIESILR